MINFFSKLKECVEKDKDMVIVSIYSVTGSAPRGVGAKMVVTDSGRCFGTVGGGRVEFEAEQHALSLLSRRVSDTESFRLAPNKVKDLGMVCGGEVSMYFQYISAGDVDVLELALNAKNKINVGAESWLITDITDASTCKMEIYCEKDGLSNKNKSSFFLQTSMPKNPKIITLNGRTLLVEPIVQAGYLYIFGGGHVSQALVPVASRVGFRCVVLDDREEFTKPELFPFATKVLMIDFSDIAKSIVVTEHDYIAIMTRGHQFDSILQAQSMRTDARYIGVMGSRSKIAHVSAQMRELGFNDEDLARIRTPIGLPIKAETPEEIAVSIVAELIMIRASDV